MVKVGFDDSGREAFLAGNERAFKKSSERIAANELKSSGAGKGGAAYSGARRGDAFSGGQNSAYRVGMISQQAQDVAVSLQMGMSASRVLAQQGSQIASIFGPQGMVIGGVIAIGAAIWEMSSETEKAARAAKKLEDHFKEIRAIRSENAAIEAKTESSIATREVGNYAGESVQLNADYREKMSEIRQKLVAANKEKAEKLNAATIGLGLPDMDRPEQRRISAQYAEKTALLEKQREDIKKSFIEESTKIAIRASSESESSISASRNSAVMSDARARESTEKDKQYSEDLQREIDFIAERNKIRDSGDTAESKSKAYADLADARAAKDDEVAATRKRKSEEESAATYLKDAENQVKLTEEKNKSEKEASQFRDTSVEKYRRAQSEIATIESDIRHDKSYGLDPIKNEVKLSEKKLELLKQEQAAVREIEAMRSESTEFTKAGLAGTEAQKKMEATQMEINLLQDKKAFAPIEAAQIANRIALLNRELVANNFNTGAAGATGMQQMNRNRESQLKAMDKAEQRALGNMGLTNIKRGLGGEIIGGVDPITGRVLDQKEIEARKFDMGLEKDRRDLDRAQTKGDTDKASKLIEKQVKQKFDLEGKAAKGDREAQERLNRLNMFKENGGKDKIAAGFSNEQITELSKSIADAVKELITK